MLTHEQLDALCNAPVHLIENHDGQVIGNSQYLALTLRKVVKVLEKFADATEKNINQLTADLEDIE